MNIKKLLSLWKKKNYTPFPIHLRNTKQISFWRKLLTGKLHKPFKLNFRTWLFFVTSLFIIGIGIYLLQQSSIAKAAWFDSGYSYRQRVFISNGGSAQTDLQVGITINTSTLITALKMQADCDDIRIVTEDGQMVPHWIQEQTADCNATNTTIWVKLPSVPTTDMNIYIYYGNASATNVEDPEEVFLFFEDFSQTTLDSGKWGTRTHASGTGSSFSIASGTARFTTTTGGGYYWLYSTEPIAQPFWIETNVRNNYATNGNVLRMGNTKGINVASNGNLFPGYAMDDAGNSTLRIVGDTTAGGFLVTSAANGTTSGIWRFGWLATSSQQAFLNDTSVMTGTNNTNPIGNSYLFLGSPANSTTGTVTVDWVFARKYVATMPTIGAFGSEETSQVSVAHWKFDEGGGTTAGDAVEGTIGTLTNGPTWQTKEQCITNNCIYFDGTNDYFDTGKDYSWSITDSFSFSFWMRPTGPTGNQTVFGKGLTGSTWEYSFKLNNLTPNFTYWNTVGGGAIQLSPSTTLTLNKWQHIVVSYNGTTGYMYIDGVQVASGAGSGTLQNRANNLTIGRGYYNSSLGATFPGFIDDFKIFNSARSESDVKQEFGQKYQGATGKAILGANDTAFLNNGLVSHWKMDETTWVGANAVLDSSGNLNSGTAVGGAGITAPGKFGNGGRFDGVNDYVTVSDHDSLDITDNLTLSAWIKTSDGTAAIMSKYNTGNFSYWFGFIGGAMRLYLGSPAGAISYSGISSPGILDNQWHHVMATYTNGETHIYIDGKERAIDDSVGAVPDSLYNGTANFEIGRDTFNGNATTLAGSIDEVRVYNRVFTEREVVQLYEWAPEPVAYWDFNENTSTTANDKSGNGFTGTITGAEWGPGKYGSALRFNGADYVDIPSPSLPGISGHLTVSAWVNGDAAIQPQADYLFYAQDVGGTRVFSAHVPWSDNTVYWDAGGGTGGTGFDRINKTAVPVEFEEDWNHWAFTKDISTGSMKMYLNGTLWHSGVGNTRPMTTPTIFRIGSFSTGIANYDGLIDDFRIYNYERTPKQIVQDMNGGHPGVGSPVGSAQAYWKMDEGYGTTINSTGGNTVPGTITGATWINDGKYGKALNFNGSGNRVAFTSAAALSTTEGTVSFWINSDQNQANPAYAFAHPQTGDNSRIYFSFDGTSVISGRLGTAVVIGTYPLTNGKWHHVAMTWKGTSAAFYGDGKDLTTTSTFNGLTSLAATSIIGAINTSGGQSFDGKMDEIKIYNYSLTADEIKVEYNQGKATVLGSASTGVGGTTPNNSTSREYCMPGDASSCNAPVGEWLLNDNTGTTAYDTSENANNSTFGAAGSAPSWAPGFQGNALQFNGVGTYATMGDALDMGTSDWTTSLWFNTTDTDGNLISKSIAASASGRWFTILQSNTIWSNMQGAVNVGISIPSAPYVDGNWHHVATTYDRDGDMSLYLDGLLKVSQSISANSATNMQNACHLLLGRYNQATDCTIPLAGSINLSGRVDQVRVYNYVRSPAQVAWEYNKGAPIAQYKMDECEGTTIYNSAPTFNDTAAGNNGTLVIGATSTNTTVGTCATSGAWADGAVGKREASMDFDGTDDYVSFGDSTAWELTAPFSLASWVKADIFHPTSTNTIASKYNTGSNQREWYLGLYLGRVTFAKYPDGGATQHGFLGNQTLEEGRWHHVVFTMDENAIGSTYVDGKFDGSGSMTNTTIFKGTAVAGIARLAAGGTANNYFRGQVDDFRIYNYVLTPQLVKTLHNNGAVSFE